MSERWMPAIGDVYWIVDFGYRKEVRSVRWVNDKIDNITYKSGNCFRTEGEAEAAAEKVKALLLSLHYNGTSTANSETLKGTFTEYIKKFAEHHADVILQKARERRLSEQYNNAPEETKLPDWCKVGEWIYSRHSNSYDKITAIKDEYYCVKTEKKCHFTIDYVNEDIVPARLRPYNAEEMKALVGKVIENCKYILWCDGYEKESNLIVTLLKAFTAEDLIKGGYTVDREPCYVLEHLENGEWVK